MHTGRSARERKFAFKQRRRVILNTTYTRGVNNERKRKWRRVQRRIAIACYKAAAASRATDRLAAQATAQATVQTTMWQMQWCALSSLHASDASTASRHIKLPVDMIAIAPPVRVAKSVPLSCLFGTVSVFYGSAVFPHTRFDATKGYQGNSSGLVKRRQSATHTLPPAHRMYVAVAS